MENFFKKVSSKVLNKDKSKDLTSKNPPTVIAEVCKSSIKPTQQKSRKTKTNVIKLQKKSAVDKNNLFKEILSFLKICGLEDRFPFSNDQLFPDTYSHFGDNEKKRFDEFTKEKLDYLKKQNNHYISLNKMNELIINIESLNEMTNDIKILKFEKKIRPNEILDELYDYIKNSQLYQVRYVDFKSLELFRDWSFECAYNAMKKISGSNNKILESRIERLIDNVRQNKDLTIPKHFYDINVNSLNSFLVFLEEQLGNCQAVKEEQQTKSIIENEIKKSNDEIECHKNDKKCLEPKIKNIEKEITSTKNSIVEINNKLSMFENCKPILDFVERTQQSIQTKESNILEINKDLENKKKEKTNVEKKINSLEKIKDIYSGKDNQKHDNLLDAVKGSKQNLIKHIFKCKFGEQFKKDKAQNASFDSATKDGMSFNDQDKIKFKKEYEEYQGYEETLQILENFKKHQDKFEKKFKLEESKTQLKSINNDISNLEKTKKKYEDEISSLKKEATNKVKQDTELPQKLNSIFCEKEKNKNIFSNFIENLFSDSNDIFNYSTKIIEMKNKKEQLSSTLDNQTKQKDELNDKIGGFDNKIKELNKTISEKQTELQNKNEKLDFIKKLLPLENIIKEAVSNIKSTISRFNQLKDKILTQKDFFILVTPNTINKMTRFGQTLGAFLYKYKKTNGID